MSGRVVVTGAAGFIGRWVVSELSGREVTVTAFDTRPRPKGFSERVEYIRGSLEDAGAMREALAGATAVIHLAFRMDLTGDDPIGIVQVNLLGTTQLFAAALETQLRRVVWASSVMVYGPIDRYSQTPLAEDAEPMPRTVYGASKLMLEWIARTYRAKGLETVALRLPTVFGPGRDRGGAAAFSLTLFDAAARGVPVTLDEGDRTAQMLYAPDAAAACADAVLHDRPLAAVYNIGGFETTVRELAGAVRQYFPRASIDVRPGGRSNWPTAINWCAATRDFGYRPSFLRDRAVAHYLDHLLGQDGQT